MLKVDNGLISRGGTQLQKHGHVVKKSHSWVRIAVYPYSDRETAFPFKEHRQSPILTLKHQLNFSAVLLQPSQASSVMFFKTSTSLHRINQNVIVRNVIWTQKKTFTSWLKIFGPDLTNPDYGSPIWVNTFTLLGKNLCHSTLITLGFLCYTQHFSKNQKLLIPQFSVMNLYLTVLKGKYFGSPGA